MEAVNKVRMKILKDGTISIDTDAFEEEVHQSAEQLIKTTFELLGGERQVVVKKDQHTGHTHTHHHHDQGHSH